MAYSCGWRLADDDCSCGFWLHSQRCLKDFNGFQRILKDSASALAAIGSHLGCKGRIWRCEAPSEEGLGGLGRGLGGLGIDLGAPGGQF